MSLLFECKAFVDIHLHQKGKNIKILLYQQTDNYIFEKLSEYQELKYCMNTTQGE